MADDPIPLRVVIQQLGILATRIRRILVLYDKSHAVYRLSGAMDEHGCPVPLVYLTDRFGEIVSTYIAREHSITPTIEQILSTLEFTNHQCPECEPPEWPR